MQQRHSARVKGMEQRVWRAGTVEAKPNLESLTAMSSFLATAKKLDRSPAAETDTLHYRTVSLA